MVITYYADVIFIWNFVLDFILLFLIHPDKKKQYVRLTAGAGVGASFVLLMLYLFHTISVWYFLLRFLCAGIMVRIAMPNRGIGEFLCNTALLYGISGCLYGAGELLSGMLNRKEKTFVIVVLAAVVLLAGRLLYSFRIRQNHRMVYEYMVKIKNGKKLIEKRAFYDSGNHLIEPISGKPVVLVRRQVMKLLEVNYETLRVVPYSSLGRKNGLLEAYQIEEIVVCNGSSEQCFRNIYVAAAEEEMFQQEACDVILHAEQRCGTM